MISCETYIVVFCWSSKRKKKYNLRTQLENQIEMYWKFGNLEFNNSISENWIKKITCHLQKLFNTVRLCT
jgi:hypothetical protein